MAGSSRGYALTSRWTPWLLVASTVAGLALWIAPATEPRASASPLPGESGWPNRAVRDVTVQAVRTRSGEPVSANSGSGGVGLPNRRSGSGPPSPFTPVPYMGWNTYYGVGGVFDERTIIAVAHALLHRGLAGAGYRIVWLDFGWASGARDRRGELVVNRHRWPHGLRWLTGWLHQRGLEAGIYTDAGPSGCSGRGVGSLGHYQQDANAFARWRFDAVKVDFCGAGQAGVAPIPAYRRVASALADNVSRRPMLLNVCNFWVPGQIDGKRPSFADSAYANYRWAPRLAQSWRTDTDIGFTGSILFKNVLRNLDRDAAHPNAARPGHFNDPDYLGPQLGMTRAEARAQFSMWAVVAAPLILGTDPRGLSSPAIRMLENRQVIAIDQDPLGIQGTVIHQAGSGQVWTKRLVGGQRAVALLNRGSARRRIRTSAGQAGLPPAAAYQLRDLWAGTTRMTSGAISTLVAPHSVVLYRVTSR